MLTQCVVLCHFSRVCGPRAVGVAAPRGDEAAADANGRMTRVSPPVLYADEHAADPARLARCRQRFLPGPCERA